MIIDIRIKFGQTYVSRYFCSRSAQGETIHHTFMGGNLVHMTWKAFGSPFVLTGKEGLW